MGQLNVSIFHYFLPMEVRMTHAYSTRNHRVIANISDAGITIIQSSISTNRFISCYTPTGWFRFTSEDEAEVIADDFFAAFFSISGGCGTNPASATNLWVMFLYKSVRF